MKVIFLNITWAIYVLLQGVQGQSKPNILYIFSDDHSTQAISAYGSQLNQTPQIDRIAREGAIFTQSFCTNSICQPSRAAILTGKHSHLNGVTYNGAHWDGNQQVYTRLLKNHGYQTALVGKWHMHPNPTTEFDTWMVLSGHGGQGTYYNPLFETQQGPKRLHGYSTDVITQKALEWLDQRNTDQPFLLKVQFKSPHVPRRPPIRLLGKYDQHTFPEPVTLHDNYATRQPYAQKAWMQLYGMNLAGLNVFPHKNSKQALVDWQEEWFERLSPEQREAFHQGMDKRNNAFRAFKRSEDYQDRRKRVSMNYQLFMRDYIACVDAVDENVGKLLDYLDQKGLAKNTIVIYSSDQSYYLGEHGWAEKRWMYEESLRMPFVIRWPDKIKAGTRVEAMIQNIDHAPSLLQMTGAPIPKDMQGKSFMPLLKAIIMIGEKDIYYHYYHHGAHNVPRHDGVRNERYKLIHFYTDDTYELYDLLKDPNEVNNLEASPEHQPLKKQLQKRLQELRNESKVPAEHLKNPIFFLKKKET